MTNYRVLPPVSASRQMIRLNGRNYSAAPGQAIDVPDFDAPALAANGWMIVAPSAATTGRLGHAAAGTIAPTADTPGQLFFDTTLGKLIVSDGTNWRDPATGAVV